MRESVREVRSKAYKAPLTVRIASWSARQRWLVIGVWLTLTISLFATGQVLGTKTYGINDDIGLDKLESQRANAAFDANGGSDPSESLVLVISHPSLKTTDTAYKQVVSQAVVRLQNLTYVNGGKNQPVFTQVIDPVTALPFLGLTSPDSSSIRTQAVMTGDPKLIDPKLAAFKPEYERIQKENPDFKFYAYSSTLLNNQVTELVAHELDGTLKVTLPLTFIILLIAFGAIAASFVPIILAVTSLLAAFGILAIYSNTISKVDSNAVQLIVLIGLAVGIDYSLFMVTRYRTERRHGKDKLSAIEIASSTAGRAVFFSGMVVMISLAGLFMIGNPIFTSMAIGTIGVVLISVIGSLTFLPATLAILGNGINWGRIPYFGRDRDEGSGFWSMLVRGVMRRPIILATLVTVALLVVAFPTLHLKLGQNGLDGLPDSVDSVKALRLLSDKWPQGTTLRVSVVVTGADRQEVKDALERFNTAALQIKGLSGPPEVATAKDGKAVRVSFYMSGNRNDNANKDIVYKLRGELVPTYFKSIPNVEAYVAGSAAFTIDLIKVYTDAMPMIFAFVLGFSFVLLLVAFHSIVIPIKAILLNLLSTGASYGVLVMVFQEGWFSEQLSFRPTGVIEGFVPIFLFTILFGLSMDYHLFILTRIKEAKDKGESSNEAVAKGISITSGVITSAAAIMVVVFAFFVTLQIMIVKQLGLGLAVAVFVDATLIRSVLLPATMRLLGDWNWYMPKFLDWIPHIVIEGESTETAGEEEQKELVSSNKKD